MALLLFNDDDLRAQGPCPQLEDAAVAMPDRALARPGLLAEHKASPAAEQAPKLNPQQLHSAWHGGAVTPTHSQIISSRLRLPYPCGL